MLTYFYIALGGALGSVARAWTTNAMVRIVGPHFPWGTILINVTGSFIIGFFGALTASDSRFPVHADARAFVMIGICGGYTTFSSFSLQTLDLLRDGKPGAAVANVAISLILCLLAVTAGYTTAMSVNGAPARTASYKSKTMGEVVLAILDRPEAVSSVLSSAARLLQYGRGGRIEALAVRTPPVAELMVADQNSDPRRRRAIASPRGGLGGRGQDSGKPMGRDIENERGCHRFRRFGRRHRTPCRRARTPLRPDSYRERAAHAAIARCAARGSFRHIPRRADHPAKQHRRIRARCGRRLERRCARSESCPCRHADP